MCNICRPALAQSVNSFLGINAIHSDEIYIVIIYRIVINKFAIIVIGNIQNYPYRISLEIECICN